MYDQGAAFRNRYLRPSRHDDYVGIVGINFKTIDNSQLHIEASTESCSTASAIAFMQGLYPPFPHTTCDLDVPAHNYCANGSMLNYPMCGYQYPNIRTIAADRDPDSIWYVVAQRCLRGVTDNRSQLQESCSRSLQQTRELAPHVFQ